eukprot:8643876-Pyramimonas_sp.AAC.1
MFIIIGRDVIGSSPGEGHRGHSVAERSESPHARLQQPAVVRRHAAQHHPQVLVAPAPSQW